jgi:hypothetical protein
MKWQQAPQCLLERRAPVIGDLKWRRGWQREKDVEKRSPRRQQDALCVMEYSILRIGRLELGARFAQAQQGKFEVARK